MYDTFSHIEEKPVIYRTTPVTFRTDTVIFRTNQVICRPSSGVIAFRVGTELWWPPLVGDLIWCETISGWRLILV